MIDVLILLLIILAVVVIGYLLFQFIVFAICIVLAVICWIKILKGSEENAVD